MGRPAPKNCKMFDGPPCAEKLLLPFDRDGCANSDCLVKPLGFGFRHPNTSVGCRVARKITCVETHPADDPEEIGHRSAYKRCAGRSRVFSHVDVFPYDLPALLIGAVNT